MSLYQILGITKMHSSRMHTDRSLTISRSACHTYPLPCTSMLPHMTPCHACPPATHTSYHTHQPCHVCPLPHTLPDPLPFMPPCHTPHPHHSPPCHAHLPLVDRQTPGKHNLRKLRLRAVKTMNPMNIIQDKTSRHWSLPNRTTMEAVFI